MALSVSILNDSTVNDWREGTKKYRRANPQQAAVKTIENGSTPLISWIPASFGDNSGQCNRPRSPRHPTLKGL
jgi:hypothetical protein